MLYTTQFHLLTNHIKHSPKGVHFRSLLHVFKLSLLPFSHLLTDLLTVQQLAILLHMNIAKYHGHAYIIINI